MSGLDPDAGLGKLLAAITAGGYGTRPALRTSTPGRKLPGSRCYVRPLEGEPIRLRHPEVLAALDEYPAELVGALD